MAERRKQITPAENDRFRDQVRILPIVLERPMDAAALDDCLALGRRYALGAYDASYLLLAQRLSLPIATLDRPPSRCGRTSGCRPLRAVAGGDLPGITPRHSA